MNKPSGNQKKKSRKTEKLVPEWVWRRDKGSWFQRQSEA